MVEFEIVVPGMYSTAINSFNRVEIKNHLRLDSVGFPEIPVISYLVAIPSCDSVNLNLTLLDSIRFNDVIIYPSPELVPDTLTGGAIVLVEEFSYDTTAYNSDEWFPGTIAETMDKGAIRDQNVVRILFYPVQFNPVDKEILAYSKAKFTLTFSNASGSINKDVGIFNEVVGNTIINYNSNGLNASVSCGAGLEESGTIKWVTSFPNGYVEDSCDYLIIVPSSFHTDTIAKSVIESLAQHRADFNGFSVVMTKTSSIYSAFPDSLYLEDFEKIMMLIKNTFENGTAYHTYDGKLAYVNLFGDVELQDGSPGIPTYSEGYDVYFTQLTYDSIAGKYDVYPDLMIGRCPVSNTAQVKNIVHKILHYKPDTLAWKNNMLNVVGTEAADIVISYAMLELDEIIEDQYNVKLSVPDNFAEPVPDWNTIPYILDTIQSAYQQGVAFFNYFGHGAVSYWQSALSYYTQIPATPNYNLPFVISVACHTGAFQSLNECLGEKFLCADSDMGAIGFIGATEGASWGTARITPLFHKALLKNYSVISGEAFLEVKLADATLLWNDDYNLLGDPALNILYENADTLFPELVIKDFEIGFNPQIPSAGDTLLIRPVIRNTTRVSATNCFYVSCKAIDIFNQDTIWIGNVLIDSMTGYTKDTASFQWITRVEDFGLFKFIFEVDTSNSITEMNELNNRTSVEKTIYLCDANMTFTSGANTNSGPIAYDIDTGYSGEEICYGRNILSSSGSTISSNGGISTGFSSIGNLSNEDNYHLLLRNSDTLFSIGLPSWEFPAPESYVLLSPPVIIDLDNDGKEEVMLLASEHGLTSTNRFLCLNHDGILRWDQAFQFNSPNFPTPCILNQITTLILSNSQNKIYYAVEYGNNLLLSDSIAIPFCINIDHNHLIADINQDGVAELVFKCRLSDFMTTSDAIAVVNLETKSISIKTLDPKKSYYFYGLSDINNDGNMEIITREQGTGIYILNYALDSLIFISEPNLYGNAFATGDFNQDGKNDIVCAIKINGRNYLRIYESTGYLLYTVPTYSAIDGLWISDIDKDEEIEIICCSTRELYVINVPNTGNTIGWPGQRGTIRNTGTALQPAYYKSNDTVYWADNILIPGSFEIPYGSTVIIKPGTHVFATEGAEFLVNGKLIAKGTENHNIQIRANIITSANNYWGGITAQTNGVVDLEYCRIENAEVGLFMYSRSPGNLKHNIFINNRVGVCTYANSPNIIGNYFNVNEIAVASHASSTPRFVGGAFSNIPYFNGLIDNDTAIAIYNSLPIVKKGKNDIYNSSNGVYMIFINDFPVNKLNVNNNYYGSSDTSVVIAHFIPSNKFIISPLLDSAQTNFKQITFDPYEELLQQAFYQFEQQQYEPAAQMFQNFIMQYPDSYLSLYAVTGEYLCYMYGEMQWEDFVQNMEYLLQDSLINTSIEKYAFEYKNLALRNKKDFAAAIDNYEKMLTQPVSYYDSLYAAINLAHTILESGLYKTSAIIADLDQQLIADDFSHVVRTKELLFSVPKDVNAFDPGENCLNIINLYPNPAHYSFSIDFSACDNGSMLIELYSANGRKVLQKTLKYKSGINQFTFDIESGKNKKINSGLYIVKLSSGSSEKTEKILLW